MTLPTSARAVALGTGPITLTGSLQAVTFKAPLEGAFRPTRLVIPQAYGQGVRVLPEVTRDASEGAPGHDEGLVSAARYDEFCRPPRSFVGQATTFQKGDLLTLFVLGPKGQEFRASLVGPMLEEA